MYIVTGYFQAIYLYISFILDHVMLFACGPSRSKQQKSSHLISHVDGYLVYRLFLADPPLARERHSRV